MNESDLKESPSREFITPIRKPLHHQMYTGGLDTTPIPRLRRQTLEDPGSTTKVLLGVLGFDSSESEEQEAIIPEEKPQSITDYIDPFHDEPKLWRSLVESATQGSEESLAALRTMADPVDDEEIITPSKLDTSLKFSLTKPYEPAVNVLYQISGQDDCDGSQKANAILKEIYGVTPPSSPGK